MQHFAGLWHSNELVRINLLIWGDFDWIGVAVKRRTLLKHEEEITANVPKVKMGVTNKKNS